MTATKTTFSLHNHSRDQGGGWAALSVKATTLRAGMKSDSEHPPAVTAGQREQFRAEHTCTVPVQNSIIN